MIELVFVLGIMVPLGILTWFAVVFLTMCGAIHLRDLLIERGIL
jgi:hypothetical protein